MVDAARSFQSPAQAAQVRRVKNASGWATTFTSRWITPGLVSYQDIKQGVGYVSREAIDRSMQSMVGRPFVILHEPKDEDTGLKIDPVTPQNMDGVAKGYLTRTYWGDDGWAWVEGICHDDEAKQLARPAEKGGKGWKVSCCYTAVGQLGGPGKLNGVPYDFEIKQFSGEHLALHPNPRYEGARIFMNGQRTPTAMSIRLFGINLGRKAEPTAAEKAEAEAKATAAAAAKAADATRLNNGTEGVDITRETKVQIPGDENRETVEATVGELTDAFLQVRNGMEMDPEQEIEYAAGKRVKLGIMCAHYAAAMETPQRREELGDTTPPGAKALVFAKNGQLLDEKGHPVTDQAAIDEAKRLLNGLKGSEPTGERHPNFLRLVNAQTASADRQLLARINQKPETQEVRIQRGKSRWGSPPKLQLSKS